MRLAPCFCPRLERLDNLRLARESNAGYRLYPGILKGHGAGLQCRAGCTHVVHQKHVQSSDHFGARTVEGILDVRPPLIRL